jgi:hypothetical protein
MVTSFTTTFHKRTLHIFRDNVVSVATLDGPNIESGRG